MTITLEQFEQYDVRLKDVCEAKVLQFSASPFLVTFELNFPNVIHQEVLKYRQSASSTSSTRAIGLEKLAENVEKHNYLPVFRRQTKGGMQGTEFFTPNDPEHLTMIEAWCRQMKSAIDTVKYMADAKIEKGIANRLLSPFMITKMVYTANIETFNHIVAQRDSADTFFPFQVLARSIKKELGKERKFNSAPWHMPYILKEESERPLYERILVAVARAARTSYEMFEDKKLSVFEKDVTLCRRLWRDRHLTPFEHVLWRCKPEDILGMPELPSCFAKVKPRIYGAFDGWIPLRMLLTNPELTETVPDELQYILEVLNDN